MLLRSSSVILAFAAATGLVCSAPAVSSAPASELWREVEVIRTAHGVPHIRAGNLRAALAASTGDGWVLAVEFGTVPRAYSVLAYGQSPHPDSPWHADQAAMFARGEMKKVAFTARDVQRQAVRRYRPGQR